MTDKPISRADLPVDSMWPKARTINRLAERDGGRRCFYCHDHLELSAGRFPLQFIVIEHARPRSRGGSNATANKVLSCWDCNVAKADLDLDLFLAESRRVA